MTLTFWHWFGLGLVLLIFEVLFASGGFLLWVGLAALVAGVVVLIFPALFWGYQLIVFSVSGIVCLLVWWNHIQRNPIRTDQPKLNRRGEQYIGRVFTLESPIVNNRGTIRVDDSTWRVEGPDLPAGATVKVIGADGVILIVNHAH